MWTIWTGVYMVEVGEHWDIWDRGVRRLVGCERLRYLGGLGEWGAQMEGCLAGSMGQV